LALSIVWFPTDTRKAGTARIPRRRYRQGRRHARHPQWPHRTPTTTAQLALPQDPLPGRPRKLATSDGRSQDRYRRPDRGYL